MTGRLLQAFGSSAQSVVGMAIIADLFHGVARARVIAITGIIYPIAFASAPILGAKLSMLYGWKSSFIFVFVGAVIYFVLFSKYVPETLRTSSKHPLSFKSAFQNYTLFLKNKLFILYCSIHSFTIAIFMLYIANAPFFYKNQMGLPMETYVYFQSIPCAGQIVMTFLSRHILKKYGMRSSFIMGAIGYVLSCFALIITANFFPNNPYIACGAMCIPYVSSTFVFAVVITKATEMFPHMVGASSGLFSFLRTMGGTILIGFGTEILNTTVPQVYTFMGIITAIIICSMTYILATGLKKEDSNHH
jgi:DHA1 family bicyclomycin/chloramphenicol resistance-like MFS transporter